MFILLTPYIDLIIYLDITLLGYVTCITRIDTIFTFKVFEVY